MRLATTTVRVERPAGIGDPYEPDEPGVVVEHVPAHISGPAGAENRVGGSQEVAAARLLVPAGTDLTRLDRIVDEATGDCWEVTWTRVRRGLGLDHRVAGLVAVEGASNA